MDQEAVRQAIEDAGSVEFARSGGPGGQNVNKLNTKVVLRVPLEALPLSEAESSRLRKLLSKRVNNRNELVVHSSETRSQATNRDRAEERAVSLITGAARPQKSRKPTRPTRGSKERRLASKKKRGEKKRLRRDPDD